MLSLFCLQMADSCHAFRIFQIYSDDCSDDPTMTGVLG